jgi:hypothetical protein
MCKPVRKCRHPSLITHLTKRGNCPLPDVGVLITKRVQERIIRQR